MLGASGSIGTQTLDVMKKNPSDFELVAFSVGRQTRKIRKIVKDFPSVKYICVKRNQQKKYYEAQYPNIKFSFGDDGLLEIINKDSDMVVNALVGFVGLRPTLDALEKNKIVCLANKESLVVGGEMTRDEALAEIQTPTSTPEQMKEYRGTLTEPGKESPYRDRDPEENLRLFHEMREGIHPDGAMCLRAKIDMKSPNINMRDPVIYRISHEAHHRSGDKWCVYPMYDFAHPLEDAIEGVTHSICTMEFEDHRPLYDWVLRETEWVNPPKQIEFARLNITNTVMSKRYLKKLIDEGRTAGC